MKEYLAATEIIDFQDAAIQDLARQLKTSKSIATAKSCFEWVRDNIYRSSDREQLAFNLNFSEEVDCKYVFSKPLPRVFLALQTHNTWSEMLNNLPDLEKDALQNIKAFK